MRKRMHAETNVRTYQCEFTERADEHENNTSIKQAYEFVKLPYAIVRRPKTTSVSFFLIKNYTQEKIILCAITHASRGQPDRILIRTAEASSSEEPSEKKNNKGKF